MKYINSLPEHQRQLLKSYRSHLDKVRVAIEHNYEIVKVIIKDVSHLFLNADHSNDIVSMFENILIISVKLFSRYSLAVF